MATPMLTVDAEARTSIMTDLELGKPTEIDEFQSEIVRLGTAHGMAVPVNARGMGLIRTVEHDGVRPLSPGDALSDQKGPNAD